MITEENIFEKVAKGNYLKVLKSDLVHKVKDIYGATPLHNLARCRVRAVLSHPLVDKVKDDAGGTPLHWLAAHGVKDVLDHSSVDIVKDNFGRTPLHNLAFWGYITKKDLRKKYPWYKKKIKNLEEAVKEILNTPKSIQFILEDL